MKTAERTIERPRVERPAVSETRRRPVLASIAMVVAAALLGLGAGFLVWGGDDTDSTSTIAVGGTELTARQEQMVELLDDYVAVWQAGDGDAAVEMFTENGVFTIGGVEYPVEGGALAALMNSRSTPTLEMLEPLLVKDNSMINFHTIAGGTDSDVIKFTAEGEVLIVSHTILN